MQYLGESFKGAKVLPGDMNRVRFSARAKDWLSWILLSMRYKSNIKKCFRSVMVSERACTDNPMARYLSQ